MKTIKPLFASCLLLVCFLFIQCDSTEILTEPTEKPYISKEKISINSLLKTIQNPSILKETETFKPNTQESILEKSGKKTDTYFTKIVKGDEYTTYLLLVNSYSAKKPYFMYYVITERDGIEKAGYIKYIPDAPEVSLDFNAFSGKIKMLDIKQKTRSESRFLNGQPYKKAESTSGKTVEYCTTTITYISHNCTNGGDHSLGETCGVGVNDAYYEFTGFDQDCYSSGYDNSGPVPNEFMNTSDGGGGGANADIEIVTFELLYLDANQKTWWNNPANIADKTEFINYLNQNPTNEAKQIASQMIAQMYGGRSATKFDVKASLYSPMNIITSTIDATTTEGKKFNEVYKSLTESPEFKKLFLDMFDGTQTRFNVKFEMGAITSGANGNTDTDLSNPTLNIITISPAFLKRSNKMEIAKTILHECIHAYLNTKMVDPTIGMSISNLNNMEFCDVVNQKYNYFLPGQNQHNFIYNFMLPTMVKVLTEVKGKLVSTDDDIDISKTILFPNHPATKPMVAFNWNECLNNLALSGLQSCSFFQNEIGTITKNALTGETIVKAIDVFKMNYYNQYNNYVQLYIH